MLDEVPLSESKQERESMKKSQENKVKEIGEALEEEYGNEEYEDLMEEDEP